MYKDISIWNVGGAYCTPVSMAMIINYNYKHLKNKSLYTGKVKDISEEHDRRDINNKLTLELIKEFNTAEDGTPWESFHRVIPKTTIAKLQELGMKGYSYTWQSSKWNIVRQFNRIRSYTKKNNPVMLASLKGARFDGFSEKYLSGNHTMPVIGYHQQYYSGVCYKKLRKKRRWLLVDTTWNSRAYIRFDRKGNYRKHLGVTYVRAY